MTGVILTDFNTRVKPKEEAHVYNKQRYLVRFDPNAPPDQQWTWHLSFTVVYPYMGSASTIQSARNAAQRKIRKLTGEDERWSERS